MGWCRVCTHNSHCRHSDSSYSTHCHLTNETLGCLTRHILRSWLRQPSGCLLPCTSSQPSGLSKHSLVLETLLAGFLFTTTVSNVDQVQRRYTGWTSMPETEHPTSRSRTALPKVIDEKLDAVMNKNSHPATGFSHSLIDENLRCDEQEQSLANYVIPVISLTRHHKSHSSVSLKLASHWETWKNDVMLVQPQQSTKRNRSPDIIRLAALLEVKSH